MYNALQYFRILSCCWSNNWVYKYPQVAPECVRGEVLSRRRGFRLLSLRRAGCCPPKIREEGIHVVGPKTIQRWYGRHTRKYSSLWTKYKRDNIVFVYGRRMWDNILCRPQVEGSFQRAQELPVVVGQYSLPGPIEILIIRSWFWFHFLMLSAKTKSPQD